jgi:hypothetical protein
VLAACAEDYTPPAEDNAAEPVNTFSADASFLRMPNEEAVAATAIATKYPKAQFKICE